MKALLLITVAVWPGIALAKGPDFMYMLQCAGQAQPVLSYRHEWEKAGFSVPNSGSSSLEDEYQFQEKRSQHTSREYLRREMYEVHLMSPIYDDESRIVWQSGIHMQPEGFGLPAQIDGCDVIPIVMRHPDPPDDRHSYLGSTDDFIRLSRIDQILLMTLLRGADPGLARFFLSTEIDALSLRERADRVAPASWWYLAYLDFEISSVCYFYNDHTPRWCHSAHLPDSDAGDEITFWPNGWPHTFDATTGAKLRVSWNPKAPDHDKYRFCIGLVSYAEDGSMKVCKKNSGGTQ